MSEHNTKHTDFLDKASRVVGANLGNEQFGVTELAVELGMSRSNLLRKIRKSTGLSVSRYIRQIRLERARELLLEGSLNVSEVAFRVGFGSTSYFIKCFREEFGFSPGGITKENSQPASDEKQGFRSKHFPLIARVFGGLLLVITVLLVWQPFGRGYGSDPKSIAVLPFINDSPDSANQYFVNGLMDAILNDLQKVSDLRVVSRTSVERFRESRLALDDIAGELGVRYIIAGSGQKAGDQVRLSIELVDTENDRHLWSEQYTRNFANVFGLQSDVARDVTGQVRAVVTREEEERIARPATRNIKAYDAFLKGLELLYKADTSSITASIAYFEEAILLDPEFARAYADSAIAYYQLDNISRQKKYSDQINSYSDKGLLYDPPLPQSLLAKALFYLYSNENDLALPYLEKALEYNPNSALVINTLSDYYANRVPDNEKYLEYALRGVALDIGSHDSVTASFIYLHISNAFIQNGFVDEAMYYADKSLASWPGNSFTEYLRAYIVYARDRDLHKTRSELERILQQDTNRLDILQEVAKICYYLRDNECAYRYYERFDRMRKELGMDIYPLEDAKIALVMEVSGHKARSGRLMEDFLQRAENDNTVHKHLSLSAYYAYHGDEDRALSELRAFSQQEHYYYWNILFIPIDPLFDGVKNLPEFDHIMDDVRDNFWAHHRDLKRRLEEEALL